MRSRIRAYFQPHNIIDGIYRDDEATPHTDTGTVGTATTMPKAQDVDAV
jgi:hypothetical protein